jgi:hypothetical protein
MDIVCFLTLTTFIVAPQFHPGCQVMVHHLHQPHVSITLGGLNCGDLLEGVIPELGELTNGLRLNTEVSSQDLTGAWVTVRWVRASQGTCLSIGSDRG